MARARNAVRLTAAGVMMMLSFEVRAEPENDPETNKAVIAQGLQAWADGTGSPYDLLDDDANWTITGNSLAAKTYPTKEAFMSEVIRPFNARMSGRLVPQVRELYADGDTVVTFFDAKGTAKDGKPYTNTYAWILKMRDKKIVQANAFFDSIAFEGATAVAVEARGSVAESITGLETIDASQARRPLSSNFGGRLMAGMGGKRTFATSVITDANRLGSG